MHYLMRGLLTRGPGQVITRNCLDSRPLPGTRALRGAVPQVGTALAQSCEGAWCRQEAGHERQQRDAAEVIERLVRGLAPGKSDAAGRAHEPRRSAAQGHVGVPRSELLPASGRRDPAAVPPVRACGYGVASALYLSARSPNW